MRKMKFSWLVGAALCVTLAACGRGSDDEVHDFFTDIARGNHDEAAARFSPALHQKFSEYLLEAALDRWTEDIASHGGLKDVSVAGGVITYNQLALYDVTLTYVDGKTKLVKTTLVHDDTGWYINTAL